MLGPRYSLSLYHHKGPPYRRDRKVQCGHCGLAAPHRLLDRFAPLERLVTIGTICLRALVDDFKLGEAAKRAQTASHPVRANGNQTGEISR